MSIKISYRFLKLLYRLLSFGTDITGGWNVLVKQKILIGTIIIGLTATSCQKKEEIRELCYYIEPRKEDSKSANLKGFYDEDSTATPIDLKTGEFIQTKKK